MSKEKKKKSFMSLIWKDDEQEINNAVKASTEKETFAQTVPTNTPSPTSTITFPEADPTVATPPPVNVGSTNCKPYMDEVMKMYEDGFAQLNLPGADFYEFLEAVEESGIDNPGAYKMAYKMLSSLDPSITKASLIENAEYYIKEIDNVHGHYTSTGQRKREQAIKDKEAEQTRLNKEVDALGEQIKQLQQQQDEKRRALINIDGNHNPKIEEIGCKLGANDAARDRITATINQVVDGINKHVG